MKLGEKMGNEPIKKPFKYAVDHGISFSLSLKLHLFKECCQFPRFFWGGGYLGDWFQRDYLGLVGGMCFSLAEFCRRAVLPSHTSQSEFASLVIVSWSVNNNFSLLRSTKTLMAKSQMMKAWHAGGIDPSWGVSFRLLALVATVASIPRDTMWQLLLSLSPLCFLCCLITLSCH